MLSRYVSDFGEIAIKFPFEFFNTLLAGVLYVFLFSHSFGSVLYNWSPLEKKLRPLSVLTRPGAEG